MAFKIYTKTGDKGTTGLIGGTRIPKHHIRIETYGTVDELNSWIGHLGDLIQMESTKIILKEIQDRLFTIGSSLACDPEKETKMHIPDLHETDIELLEKQIDLMNETLPELKHFVLPGGEHSASLCHIVRCVCRRAERNCVSMQHEHQFVDDKIIIYLNRLSDYLFVLARFLLYAKKGKESIWEPRISKQ